MNETTNKTIDEEINEELKTDAPNVAPNAAPSEPSELNAARKPFHVHNFDTPRDKQMAVFTHAKKLSEYIFVITEKSPIKLRWSIVSRLINASVDVIECLYRANCERGEARIEWQKRAMVSLNLLDFYAETAKKKQAINFKQMSVIAAQLSEVKKMLIGWVRVTKEANKSQI